MGILFNKALTSVCRDCPLSIISHKWGPETRSVCVCVPVIVSPNNTYTRGVIFGYMPSMHQEHGNEMNTLAQVIEQSPTHKQSYLCVEPCSHMCPLILPMVLNSNTFFAPSHTRYLTSTSNLKHAITSLHARLYFFFFPSPIFPLLLPAIIIALKLQAAFLSRHL